MREHKILGLSYYPSVLKYCHMAKYGNNLPFPDKNNNNIPEAFSPLGVPQTWDTIKHFHELEE